jgi:hypothetical protein
MPHRSRIVSREAGLWRRLRPRQAQAVLRRYYGPETRAEALLRAYLSERDRDGEAVRFWLRVYDSLASAGKPERR